MAVVASPMLWIVSASRATEPEAKTITSWSAAVTARITNDDLIAQMPVVVVASIGSTKPCVCPLGPRPRDDQRAREVDAGCQSQTNRQFFSTCWLTDIWRGP